MFSHFAGHAGHDGPLRGRAVNQVHSASSFFLHQRVGGELCRLARLASFGQQRLMTFLNLDLKMFVLLTKLARPGLELG